MYKHSTPFPYSIVLQKRFFQVFLMDSQEDTVFLMAMRCEEAGKKIQISLPKYSSWTFKCRDNLFCRLPSGHWSLSPRDNIMKCEYRIPTWMKFRSQNLGFPRKSFFLITFSSTFPHGLSNIWRMLGMKFRSQNLGIPRDSNASNLHNLHTHGNTN